MKRRRARQMLASSISLLLILGLTTGTAWSAPVSKGGTDLPPLELGYPVKGMDLLTTAPWEMPLSSLSAQVPAAPLSGTWVIDVPGAAKPPTAAPTSAPPTVTPSPTAGTPATPSPTPSDTASPTAAPPVSSSPSESPGSGNAPSMPSASEEPTPSEGPASPSGQAQVQALAAPTAAPTWEAAGDSGIFVAQSTPDAQQRGGVADPVSRVAIEILDIESAQALGLNGLAVRVSRADGSKSAGVVDLRLADSLLTSRYGADYASRVRWVQVPDCAVGSEGCEDGQQLSSAHDPAARGTSVQSASAGPQPMLVVAMSSAASSAGTGDFGATALSPSGNWQVSTQTGDFSWSYPLRVPPASAGPQPSLALTYSSGSVDGRTGSTNNQPSWIGEGWNLSSGFVERSYASCADDTSGGGPSTGDLCWKGENLTLSLDGRSSMLVRDTVTGAWRLRDDDGSRVEKLTGAANGDNDGEHWRLTTQEGTQYYFGLNLLPGWTSGKPQTQSAWTVPVFGNDAGEPCSTGTLASSYCDQGWRWNLDYVVDTHGNSEVFYYAPETNLYGRNLTATSATSYIRGGALARVDYGMRYGSELTAPAPARVVFDTADRCVTAGPTCTSANPANWPDVPWDQSCAASPCTDKYSPTFWATKRLAAVRTEIHTAGALPAPTYGPVDTWPLTHTFPDPGDTTSAALWLDKIGHTGQVNGTIALPSIEFAGVQKYNRVWAVDGLLPLTKWRISSIKTETGAVISVNYSSETVPNDGRGCTPTNLPASAETNTMRCFPQWWQPPIGPAKLDYFHKYLVVSVHADAVTGGANPVDQTYYDYTGAPAWRWDDSALTPDTKRTWSDYHGYSEVQVRHGDYNTPAKQTRTVYKYFQGMNGDRLNPSGGAKSVSVTTTSEGTSWPDDRWLQGRMREQISYVGNTATWVTSAVTDPWASPGTATDGIWTARIVRDGEARTRTALASAYRSTQIATTYNADGLPTAVDDLGDTSTAVDDVCTRTSYAPNTVAWIIAAPYETTTMAVNCGTTPTLPLHALGGARTYYDNATVVSTAPVIGDATKTEVIKSYTGAAANWLVTSTGTYDALGRSTSITDTLGRTTSTSYTPATGLVASTTVTNPLLWTATTSYQREWGLPLTATDQNAKITEATYDALGRRTAVWLTDRPRATMTASITFAYTIPSVVGSGPVTISTTVLNSTGGTMTSYALYDGLLRPRQGQRPSEGGGRVIADTVYDAAGRIDYSSADFYTTGSPSTTLFEPASMSLLPARTQHQYDGAGRQTAQILYVLGTEKWRTSYAHFGDHIDTTPPTGASAVTVYTDARGNATSHVQWRTNAPGGASDTTTYKWYPTGQLKEIKDPTGLNVWSYGYDMLGRRTSQTDPDSGSSSYTYDDAGRMTASTDARGATLFSKYDLLDRKTELRNTSATGTLLASWTWDTMAKGQPTSSTRHVGTAQYIVGVTGYDDAYRSLGDSVTIPGSGGVAGLYTTANTYNVDGSLKQTVIPAMGGLPAETLRYEYTAYGNAYSMRGPSLINYVTAATYDHTNRIAQMNQGSSGSTTTKNFYYEQGTNRLTRTVASSYGSGAGGMEDRNYSYDNAGNITKIKNDGTGTTGVSDTQCFSYDYLRQLTQAWTPSSTSCAAAPTSTTLGGPAPYWKTYTYDSAGLGKRIQDVTNPVGSGSATTTNYTYPAAGSARPHAVSSHSVTVGTGSPATTSYVYDAAGNTTSRGGQTIQYDTEGRQASINTTAASMVYDAAGNRLTYTDSTGTTLYLGSTEIRSTTAGLSSVRTYTFAGQAVAVRTSTAGVAGTIMNWIDADHQGTASVASHSNTGVKTRRYTDPFGNPRGTNPSWPGGHGFLDKPVDTVSGTTHLGAREYSTATGRFQQPDPLMGPFEPLSLNAYAYSRNNPVTMSDPNGLAPGDVGGALGGALKQKPVAEPYQVTKDLYVPGGTKNADKIKKGVEDFAKRANLTWETDEYIDSRNQVYAFQSYCSSSGSFCDSDLRDYMFKLERSFNLAGTDYLYLESNTVVGGKTPSGMDWLALVAELGPILASSGSNGQIQAAPIAGRKIRETLQEFGVVKCKTGKSFSPDTRVAMADGTTKPIAEMKIGDLVLSADVATGEVTAQTVTAVWINHDDDLLDIRIHTDTGEATLHTTQSHDIWDHTERAWTAAGDLEPGDLLLSADGTNPTVDANVIVAGSADMWDLTVTGNHNYFAIAGSSSVLCTIVEPTKILDIMIRMVDPTRTIRIRPCCRQMLRPNFRIAFWLTKHDGQKLVPEIRQCIIGISMIIKGIGISAVALMVSRSTELQWPSRLTLSRLA